MYPKLQKEKTAGAGRTERMNGEAGNVPRENLLQRKRKKFRTRDSRSKKREKKMKFQRKSSSVQNAERGERQRVST